MKPIDGDRLKGHVKGDANRRERLAAELRLNLKRRKEQGRSRTALDRTGDVSSVEGSSDRAER